VIDEIVATVRRRARNSGVERQIGKVEQTAEPAELVNTSVTIIMSPELVISSVMEPVAAAGLLSPRIHDHIIKVSRPWKLQKTFAAIVESGIFYTSSEPYSM